MGTTLTGTTPQDTYDSLIKVTDNGPLGSTAKYLSDGLGNDSKLALSTGNIGINTTTPDIFGRFYTYSLGIDSSGSTAIQIDGTSYSTIDMGANGVRLGFLSQSGTETSLGNLSTIPLTFQTNSVERMRITSTGNVGIGTSSPQRTVHVNVGSAATSAVRISNSATGTGANDGFEVAIDSVGNAYVAQKENLPLVFLTNDTERMRITEGGNVGIGTSAPNQKLHVVGNVNLTGTSWLQFESANAILGEGTNTYVQANGAGSVIIRNNVPAEIARFLPTGGITFNGDTAAANALDDYEEGTWTMGVSFDTASAGASYSYNTGKYTKIGRKVTVSGFLLLSSKGSSTGNARITGLPFTVASGTESYAPAALWFENLTFANQYMGYSEVGTTYVRLQEITEGGALTNLTDADFANNTGVMVSLTYFV